MTLTPGERTRRIWLFLGLFLIAHLAVRADALAPDPRLRSAELPNGFRYVIFPRRQPAEQVSVRLVVRAGSVDESDSARGLAHFIEHMVFNGTTHYPRGSVEKFLRENGLSIGADANADTHFGYTNYRFDLPKSKNLPVLLELLRDVADGATFERSAVEHEKKIILAEVRMRDTSDDRVWRAGEETVMAGSPLADREPIGAVSVVSAARPEQLRKLYQRLYRPERMELIIVGDVDPGVTEKQIQEAFSSIQAKTPEVPRPAAAFTRERAWRASLTRSDLHNGNVFALITVTAPQAVHTEDDARRLFFAKVAEKITDLRLQRLAAAEPQNFSFCNIQIADEPGLTTELICQISPHDPEWRKAATRLQLELRSSLEQGFSQIEIDEMLQIALHVTADNLAQDVGTSNLDQSNELVSDYLNDRVTRSPEQDLGDVKRFASEATPANVLAAWRELWSGWRIAWLQLGQTFPASPTRDEMLGLLEQNASAPLPERKATAEVKFPYDHFGASGEIVSRRRLENLDTDEVVFKNGLRLLVKKTSFAPHSATMTLRLGNGRLSEPKDKPGLGSLGSFWFLGGLKQMGWEDLSRFILSNLGEVSVASGSDAIVASTTSNPDQMLAFEQVLAAYLTEPAFAKDQFSVVAQDVLSRETQLWDGPQGIFLEEVGPREHNGDPRYFSARRQEIARYRAEDVTAWLQDYLRTSDVSLIVVGDVDLEKIVAETSQTVGAISLPVAAEENVKQKIDWTTWTEKPTQMTYNFETGSPMSVVGVDWPVREPIDAELLAKARLLCEIMTERARVQIRQDRGQSYATEFGFTDLPGPQGGWIRFFSDCKAADVPRIVDESANLLNAFRKKGVTAAELERAKNVLLASAQSERLKNQFWVDLLSGQILDPSSAERVLEYPLKVRATQITDLDAFGQKYLRLDTAFVTRIIAHAPSKKTR